jgi:ubiquinone/menaquinone biosynthesis C-methylase UbiE
MTTDLPSPRAVFDAFTAYQRTAAMKAAIELDLFTAIGEGAATAAELAPRCSAAERGIRSLCDRLVVDGFLTKEAGRYGLGPDAAVFLDRRSPAYAGSAVLFMASPTVMGAFASLTDAVRRGGTAIGPEGTLAPEHPVWVEFARAMAPMAAMTAELLATVLDAEAPPPRRVLDVAAGHGMYGVALARRHPSVHVVALDWPNVLAVAEEHARAAGVADRFRGLAGSAFDVDLGSGYDLVLLTNFLHHFDPATCERLLAKVHATLAPGGRAAAVEFVPHEDRVAPPEAAAFSLVMLASTPHGDAYTFAEYERVFRAAGFTRATLHALAPSPQHAIVAER